MFPIKSGMSVGQRNIRCAQDWLDQHRLTWKRTDLGGVCGRKIALNITTGFIELSYLTSPPAQEEYHAHKRSRG